MNAKQFINTSLLEGVDWVSSRSSLLAQAGQAFADVLFPRILRPPIPRFWRKGPTLKGIVLAYLCVFAIFFATQAVWAARNGMLFPDTKAGTKTFLEDKENLLNYTIIAEAYCIIGFLFLSQIHGVRTQLRRDRVPLPPDDQAGFLRRGYLAATAIILLPTIGSTGYALEIHKYSSHYWFMATGPPGVTLGAAGYYYVFVNLLLLIFVVWVGFAHFGLFHVARDVSSYLREVATSDDSSEMETWADDETPKQRLATLSRSVVTSKILVFCVMLNMLAWRANEPNVGNMYGLSVILAAVFGIWIFSLPRYAVQRHLFRIRQRAGKSSYPDIRGPWILGLSSLLDILLFSFIINYLLGDAAGKLLKGIFS